MTPTVSASATFVTEPEAAPARNDLSAATGIVAGVAMSAVFWIAIGYAVDALIG